MTKGHIGVYVGLVAILLSVSACSADVVPNNSADVAPNNVALYAGPIGGDGEMFGPGTVRIDEKCVTFETAGFRPMTLGWPEDSVSWESDSEAIVLDSVKITNGTFTRLGGHVEARGEWVVPPLDGCPDTVLFVSGVGRG